MACWLLFTSAPYVLRSACSSKHSYSHTHMHVCGCTQSPFPNAQTQLTTPTRKHNHMHQITRFMTLKNKTKGGQLCFHHQNPNQQEGKTKPDEHMVQRAAMDCKEWGTRSRQKETPGIKMTRLQVFFFLTVSSRCCMVDNPCLLQRCLSSLIKH